MIVRTAHATRAVGAHRNQAVCLLIETCVCEEKQENAAELMLDSFSYTQEQGMSNAAV